MVYFESLSVNVRGCLHPFIVNALCDNKKVTVEEVELFDQPW